jgi:hypothetical protein
MRKKILLSVSMLVIFLSVALAQERKTPPSFDGYHKNIYVEFFGSHILTGVNFDMRLNKGRMDGMGFRAGIGGISLDADTPDLEANIGIVTFPLEFNYLVGKRRSSFEAGVGLLPAYATVSGRGEVTDNRFVSAEGFGLAGGFLTLGYRLQPRKNGFMMNIRWNPLILRNDGFNAGWFSIGLGVGFK